MLRPPIMKKGRLRELREARGLSQSQLAQLVGVDQSDLSHIEAGRHDPRLDTALKLARALGVSVEELVG